MLKKIGERGRGVNLTHHVRFSSSRDPSAVLNCISKNKGKNAQINALSCHVLNILFPG